MGPIRCRPRLGTLLLLTAFVALAAGAFRTWQTSRARRPRPSERLARSLLDARSARLDRAGAPSRDDLLPAAVALGGSLLIRGLGRRAAPGSPSPRADARCRSLDPAADDRPGPRR